MKTKIVKILTGLFLAAAITLTFAGAYVAFSTETLPVEKQVELMKFYVDNRLYEEQ